MEVGTSGVPVVVSVSFVPRSETICTDSSYNIKLKCTIMTGTAKYDISLRQMEHVHLSAGLRWRYR